MIRKRPEKDTENPPGQIIERRPCPNAPGPCYCDGSCMQLKHWQQDKTLKDYIERVQKQEGNDT